MIPIEQFGKDHWSTFAYIETLVVDKRGVPSFERMRCDTDRHPQFGHMYSASFKTKYPTRLKGGVERADHDDWDCVEDLEAAGLVRWRGTGINPVFALTELGWKAASSLRQHKSDPKATYASFEFKPSAEEVREAIEKAEAEEGLAIKTFLSNLAESKGDTPGQ